MAKYFLNPFAVSGTKTAVPNTTQPDGSVSYEQGYGAKYSLPITDPDALRIERAKMNDFFYEVTNAIRTIQQQGIADWISNSDNGGTAYAYAINAIVRYTDGKLYRSTSAANTALPTNASFWVCISDPQPVSQGGTGITSYTLGDLIFASATAVLSKLAGNITTTRKFLKQVGDGTNSAAPEWDTITKADVGLSNVDNTSDMNKPVSTAQSAALALKASLASVNVYTAQQNFQTVGLTDGASIAWNLNTAQVASVTLGGNRTLANPTNLVNGGTYILRVTQDGTGTRTLAYGSAYKWAGGVAPVLSIVAGSVDILTFISDGTNMYGTIQKGFA